MRQGVGRVRLPRVLLALLPAVLAAGCSRPPATAAQVPPLAGTAPNGEERRTGPQLVADAASSLTAAASVEVSGTLVVGGVPTPADLLLQADGDLSGSLGAAPDALVVQRTGDVVAVRPTGRAGPLVARLGLPAALADPAPGGAAWSLPAALAPSVTAWSLPAVATRLLPAAARVAPALRAGDVDGTPVVTAVAGGATVSVADTGDVRLVRLAGGAAGPGGVHVTVTRTPVPPPLPPVAVPAPGLPPTSPGATASPSP